MFNIGFPELILILIIALVVVGPDRLPEVAKMLGKTIRTIKNAMDNVKDTIEQEVAKEVENPISTLQNEIKEEIEKVYSEAAKDETEIKKTLAQSEDHTHNVNNS